jgi:natural product precursor
MKDKMSLFKMSDRKMKTVKGMEHSCGCGCFYANSGGSSTSDNSTANKRDNLWSVKPEE